MKKKKAQIIGKPNTKDPFTLSCDRQREYKTEKTPMSHFISDVLFMKKNSYKKTINGE